MLDFLLNKSDAQFRGKKSTFGLVNDRNYWEIGFPLNTAKE